MIESPELIADDPYGEGWLLKVRVDDPDERTGGRFIGG